MAAKPDYAGELLAACCGNALHIWRPKIGGEGEDKAVPFDRSMLAAAWNRNNKVVACAREDGNIELRYSNGALMSQLPRGGVPPGTRPAVSLAWSMGSKRLAAGCLDGNVYLHDMTEKTLTPLSLGSSPLGAVAFHPDDRFLATAGRTVSLFSVPKLASFGNLPLDFDVSGFTSLGIASGQPAIAAGTTCGCVAMWDYKTRQQLHVDHSRHVGGTSAVQFAPLDANILYTAGRDGALLMQDVREAPFHVPTVRIGTGTGLTTLSIREDFTYLAAGTADGKVLLYDPRYCAAPAATLRCRDPSPVTCLHWQHNYQSLTTKAKELAAGAAAEGTLPPGRIAIAMPDSDDSSSPSTEEGGKSSPAQPNPARLSLASSLATHIEPPRKLDVSPAVSLRTSRIPSVSGAEGSGLGNIKTKVTEAGGNGGIKEESDYVDHGEALLRLRRESTAGTRQNPAPTRGGNYHANANSTGIMTNNVAEPAVPSNTVPPSVVPSAVPSTIPSPAVSSPTSSAAISLDRTPRDPSQQHSAAVPSMQYPFSQQHGGGSTSTNGYYSDVRQSQQTDQNNNNRPPASPPQAQHAQHASRDNGAGSSRDPWCIKAVTPKAEREHLGDEYTIRDNFEFRQHGVPDLPRESPTKAALMGRGKPSGPSLGERPGAAALRPAREPTPDGFALHQDILALHLDLLNQFKAQQESTAALVAGVMARQDSLAEEVASLRRELRDLLSRRDGMLWL